MDRKPIPLEHPYAAARHEWDERYGGLLTRARNWRIAALLAGITAFLAVAGLLWSAAHSHVVPFVVLVDRLARPVAAGVADETTANDDRLKRAALFGWIENLRSVGNKFRCSTCRYACKLESTISNERGYLWTSWTQHSWPCS